MNFADTPICQSRTNCFQCRNNENFRKQMEQQYGTIECPEGFAVGAKIDDLPTKSQEAYKRMIEMQVKRQQQIDELNSALSELSMIIPEEGKKLVDKIRNIISPQTKTPEMCKHGGKQIGEVEEECCGGQIKQKPVFKCQKHTLATATKCISCEDFAS